MSSKLDKIKAKAVTEVDVVTVVLERISGMIKNEADRSAFATLHEVFIFMMDINLYDYAGGKYSVKEIVNQSRLHIEKFLKLRKIN